MALIGSCGYHAFTLCHSTSAFDGREDVSSFKLLEGDDLFRPYDTYQADIQHLWRESVSYKQHTSVIDVRHRMSGTQATDTAKFSDSIDPALI